MKPQTLKIPHGLPHPSWGTDRKWDKGSMEGRGGVDQEGTGIDKKTKLVSNLN